MPTPFDCIEDLLAECRIEDEPYAKACIEYDALVTLLVHRLRTALHALDVALPPPTVPEAPQSLSGRGQAGAP